MALILCSKCGQYFDADQQMCPYCGNVANDNEGNTIRTELYSSTQKTDFDVDNKTELSMPIDNFNANEEEFNNINSTDNNETIIINSSNQDNPKRLLVGWLVVIEGPGKGEDLKVFIGQNSIGRNATNTICINFGDNTISREKHAYIIYDPKFHKFMFKNGEGQNLSYLNEEGVYSPLVLKHGDIIELGNTKLRFVQFCDENFNWKE